MFSKYSIYFNDIIVLFEKTVQVMYTKFVL